MGRYAIWIVEIEIFWKRENLEKGTVYSKSFVALKGSPQYSLCFSPIFQRAKKIVIEVCG